MGKKLSADSRRTAAAALTKRAIVAVARLLFAERGYEAVGLRQVCRAAECSTGALFAHFASKVGLFAQAMDRPAPTAARLRLILSGAVTPDQQTEALRQVELAVRDLWGVAA